jgi:hypothetical protein
MRVHRQAGKQNDQGLRFALLEYLLQQSQDNQLHYLRNTQ